MNRIVKLALSSVLLIAACASTSMVSTWQDPSAGKQHFSKVLVVVPTRDEALRRTAEDELAQRIHQGQAVQSYTLLSSQEIGDREHLKDRVRQLGFDGLLVFRIAKVDKETNWVPGTYWGPYYAFGGWPSYDPGYVQTDTVVSVETDVYSVADDRLIWASRSKTYDPKDLRHLVDEVSDAVGKEMRQRGFIS